MRVLSDLQVGECGILVALDLPLGVKNHLMYMGFVPHAEVCALHRAPAGDPTVYSVGGMVLALRRETARAIQVQDHTKDHTAETVPEHEMAEAIG